MGLSSVEQQLRSFLLGVAAFIFIGAVAELYLLDHYEETQQWIPIILSLLGFAFSVSVWWKPARTSLTLFRWLMGIVAAASLYGMYLHFMGNYQFTLEINPSFSAWEAVWPAMKGSYPLLAPGMLLVAALIGAAGTYRHPAMEK